VVHYFAIGLGSTTTALSSAAVATSLSGIGIATGAPLGDIAALFGCASTFMTGANKKLQTQVKQTTDSQRSVRRISKRKFPVWPPNEYFFLQNKYRALF